MLLRTIGSCPITFHPTVPAATLVPVFHLLTAHSHNNSHNHNHNRNRVLPPFSIPLSNPLSHSHHIQPQFSPSSSSFYSFSSTTTHQSSKHIQSSKSNTTMVALLVATTSDPASINPANALLAMPGWQPGPHFQVSQTIDPFCFFSFFAVLDSQFLIFLINFFWFF